MHIDERHSLPRKATTNYKAKMGKGYLTIEQIWFLAKSTAANPKAAHPAYLKEALAAKFAAVSLVDRKDLLDFLTGKVASSANIDLNVPAFADVPGEAARDVAGAKRSREDGDAGGDAGGASRARPLHTRNSALQCDKSFGAVLGFFGAAEGGKEKPKPEEPKIAPLKSTRFEDVDTREFYKAQLGSDFTDLGIVENAGFLGGNRKVLPELSAAEQARAEAVTGHKIEKRGADKALPVAGRASRSASRPARGLRKGQDAHHPGSGGVWQQGAVQHVQRREVPAGGDVGDLGHVPQARGQESPHAFHQAAIQTVAVREVPGHG